MKKYILVVAIAILIGVAALGTVVFSDLQQENTGSEFHLLEMENEGFSGPSDGHGMCPSNCG